MRDYGKVFSTFWTSDSTRELSDDAKMLALYLLTGPHSNIIGCFRLPDGYVSEDMGWSIQRVSKGFTELFRKGFATREENTKWVFISKHLKWNPLENPNQITGALKLYDQIPDASSVKPLIAKVLREYTRPDLKGYETLPEPFRNPSRTLSKPETETETVAESEAGERARTRVRPKPPPPPEKLKFGEHGNVLLTQDEHDNLCRKFTPEFTQKAIAFLDLHIGAKGKDEYKSHSMAMQKWVFDAVQEREAKQARASPPGTQSFRSLAQLKMDANRAAADRAEELLFGAKTEERHAAG